MDGRCSKHPFEGTEGTCRNCGGEFCNECLVFAFGPTEPPLCVSCALAAAGVRANAGRQSRLSRRELRKQNKQQKQALKEKQANGSGADRDAIEMPGADEAADEPAAPRRIAF